MAHKFTVSKFAEEGDWVTINGRHVQIGADGKPDMGDKGTGRVGGEGKKEKVSDKKLLKELDDIANSGGTHDMHIKHIQDRLGISKEDAEAKSKEIWK